MYQYCSTVLYQCVEYSSQYGRLVRMLINNNNKIVNIRIFLHTLSTNRLTHTVNSTHSRALTHVLTL